MKKQSFFSKTKKIFKVCCLAASSLILGLGFVQNAVASLITVEVGTFFAPELGLGQSAEGTQKLAITYDGVGPNIYGLAIDLGINAELDNRQADDNSTGTNQDDMAIFAWDLVALSGPGFQYNDLVGAIDDPITHAPWDGFFVTTPGLESGESIVFQLDLDPKDGGGFGNPDIDYDLGINDYLGGSVIVYFEDFTTATADFSDFFESASNNPGCIGTLVDCAFAYVGDVPPPLCPFGGVYPDNCNAPPNGDIPEPTSIALIALGLIGMSGRLRNNRAKALKVS